MIVKYTTSPKVVLKNGHELTDNEVAQIKEAILREFKVPFPSRDQLKDRLYFLLKQDGIILAMGALWEVRPVIFNGVEFTLFGILNVVANKKGQGYGKQVLSTMREYLSSRDVIGLGFCMPKNRGFYEKCGFVVNTKSTQRFVYRNAGKKITNQDGQYIFYQDSSDHFMEKILSNPGKEVSIPTPNLW